MINVPKLLDKNCLSSDLMKKVLPGSLILKKKQRLEFKNIY